MAYANRPTDAGMSAAVLIALAFLIASFALLNTSACTPEVAEPEHSVHYTQGFVVDSTDAWEMHTQGLPTKDDVLNWHMCGYWGFGRWNDATNTYDATLFEELPGGSETWDALYGLDHENPAYRF